MDPLIHAEMSLLVQREKKLEQEITGLREEVKVWKRRVELAESKGMMDLAEEGIERVVAITARGKAVKLELEVIEMEKSILRKEHRRPDGKEVARAEALLQAFRESGLVDPEEASLERRLRELAEVDNRGGEE